VNGRPDNKSDIPKPKEDIGLFVNDVCCQYTETIFVFDGSGWTILMEGTLGDLWEHFRHWIYTFLDGKLTDSQNIGSVCGKLISEEHVHEVNLADDVHKVEKLTNDEFIDVAGMGIDMSNKVICDRGSSVLLCIFIKKVRGV